jgi:wyosine [tRNA(Phe)-imidazoG37] synthetase (radical SAM superfamily)
MPNESIFMREYLVSKSKQTMPISARCNLRCIFCSNYSNPFPITKDVFRDLEDIKLNIPILQPSNGTINISENIPGRIAEGETLLHPKLFEILDLIRKRFKYTEIIEFSANGTTLTEDMIRKLYAYMPIRIKTFSLNSSNIDYWQEISGGTKKQGEIAIKAVELLKKYSIPFHGSIVALPMITGWDGIEETIRYYEENNALEIIIWHPGHSKLMADDVKEKMECSFEELSKFTTRMRKAYKKPFHLLPDLLMPCWINIQEIMDFTQNLGKSNVLWLVSEAAKEILSLEVEKYSPYVWNQHFIMPVKNLTYGGNIIVSGLLTVDDFIRAGKEYLKDNSHIDLILVPNAPFDAAGQDLLYTPSYKIEEELGCQTKLV